MEPVGYWLGERYYTAASALIAVTGVVLGRTLEPRSANLPLWRKHVFDALA